MIEAEHRRCAIAVIEGRLWEWNLMRVVVVDVTEDYRHMLEPMPSEFYPVLRELWLPRYKLSETLQAKGLVSGYLYDWHEAPEDERGSFYVGVVQETLASDPMFAGGAAA